MHKVLVVSLLILNAALSVLPQQSTVNNASSPRAEVLVLGVYHMSKIRAIRSVDVPGVTAPRLLSGESSCAVVSGAGGGG
jgi:hypothetical protein